MRIEDSGTAVKLDDTAAIFRCSNGFALLCFDAGGCHSIMDGDFLADFEFAFVFGGFVARDFPAVAVLVHDDSFVREFEDGAGDLIRFRGGSGDEI